MHRFVSLLFLSAVCGQLQFNTTCDLSSIPKAIVNDSAVAGMWYQLERIPNSVEKGECSHSFLEFEFDNSSTIVAANKYDSEVVSRKLVQRNATISPVSVGVWNLTYNDGSSQEIVILGTDYTEYLVLYSCQNTGNASSSISAWKYGRNTTYSQNATNKTSELVSTITTNTVWKTVLHSADACKVSSAVNLHISPILLLLVAIGFAKGL